MTLLPACGWSLLRSAAVGVAVLWAARALSRVLAANGTSSVLRPRLAVVLLVCLCVMPDLAVGYAWADTGLSLVQFPALNEGLYALLLAGKLLPLATVLCLALPPSPLSDSAGHCASLAGLSQAERLRLWLEGSAGQLVPVGGVVFLLAFQDFELASRMDVRAWTITLFDLHSREGLPLADSIRLAILPATIELLVIAPALAFALRQSADHTPGVARPVRQGTASTLVVVLLAALVFVVPAWTMLHGTLAGGSVLVRDAIYRQELPREIAAGVLVATLSALAALLIGGLLAEGLRRRPALVLLLIPGLLGGLVLSLIGRWAGQTVDRVGETLGLPGLYRTPVPLIVAQTILLLPRGTLIAVLLQRLTRSSALHLAELLSESPQHRRAAGELLWESRGRSQFWAAALLMWWGYWDLTTFSLLAPTGFVSAPVRLYNFMHYRQNDVLSAMLAAAVVLPALAAALAAWGVRRLRV